MAHQPASFYVHDFVDVRLESFLGILQHRVVVIRHVIVAQFHYHSGQSVKPSNPSALAAFDRCLYDSCNGICDCFGWIWDAHSSHLFYFLGLLQNARLTFPDTFGDTRHLANKKGNDWLKSGRLGSVSPFRSPATG